MEGQNGFGQIGYGGPCPPSGTHSYFFKVYALDTQLQLPWAQKEGRGESHEGHILAKGELMGTTTGNVLVYLVWTLLADSSVEAKIRYLSRCPAGCSDYGFIFLVCQAATQPARDRFISGWSSLTAPSLAK